MTVILDTLEAESRRIVVLGQPRQKVHETPSQPIAGHGGAHLSSQARGEAEIRRIVVPVQPWQKVCKTPSQWRKDGYSGIHPSSQ
jgi:hypothetical protein